MGSRRRPTLDTSCDVQTLYSHFPAKAWRYIDLIDLAGALGLTTDSNSDESIPVFEANVGRNFR
jgi:hypothetical protein